ncbi:MAG: amidohydrolase family protein [Thaumarchaeota archaeon]|nr:amidohydrolase family protein [Nitrososphaerota archaeon]
MRIDFETHYYPREFISKLKERSEFPRFAIDENGGLVLEYGEKVKIPRQRLLAKFTDRQTRLKDMESAGIDLQVLSIPFPGVDKMDQKSAVEICRGANNGIADFCEKNTDKFVGFALLPLQSGGEAVEELRRSVKDLGLKGAYVHSNTNGKFLDSKDYREVMKASSKLGVPVFVHPTIPFVLDDMAEHRLASTFGLQVDLSLSLLRLIFGSGLEENPELRLIVSHLGGTLSFISNVMDDEFEFARAPETKIAKKPSEYIKRLYVDTVTMDSRPLEFAHDYFGSDHIVFGSDYPFWDSTKHVDAVIRSNLSEDQKEDVFFRTASKLLNLN